jgi:hypothetical protein
MKCASLPIVRPKKSLGNARWSGSAGRTSSVVSTPLSTYRRLMALVRSLVCSCQFWFFRRQTVWRGHQLESKKKGFHVCLFDTGHTSRQSHLVNIRLMLQRI